MIHDSMLLQSLFPALNNDILTLMIALTNVSKEYGSRKVLDGVSLSIEPRECVCILGAGDSGKSTLLSLLIGAAHPTSGTVTIDGADLRTIPSPALQLFRRKVGIMFQDGKLLSTRTVAENIAFQLEMNGENAGKTEKRVSELLRRLHLENRRDALPDELSSGEKARVAFARAIAHKPLILLCDEPLRNMDDTDGAMVLEMLRELHATGTTVIVMTRDAALAAELRARVIRLGKGKITGSEARPQRTEAAQTPKELAKTHVEAIEKRRKIRVTAIHSE